MGRGLVAAALIASILTPSAAWSQAAGALALSSDYRLRGISITDRGAALSLAVSDDLASGLYLGGLAVAQEDGGRPKVSGHMEYAGYARRTAGGLVWEGGLTNQRYTLYGPTPFHLSYSEAYVGFSSGRFATRISYSPNYAGHGHDAVYLETNGALRPADAWRIAGHVGVFEALNRWPGTSLKPRFDARLDLVRRVGPAELSLGWAVASPPIRPATKLSRGGLVMTVTAFF